MTEKPEPKMHAPRWRKRPGNATVAADLCPRCNGDNSEPFELCERCAAERPWCCNGNAEDCALCTGTNPPYPFICPGHPHDDETRAKRRRALAFNAVGPALKARDQWLPLSVRQAVADAVLAAVDTDEEGPK
ncbi:hypothetical protein [Streptomyces sp. t39]|uniref:hypothetical protein n=1 Tax=Streptomyces sp. t39 TaxID=1828156 RepID=UPI0011CE38AB|nr:hypothetical protein [Streptomyces sp. t39]TXS50144.1 hypothetical protein EAO77_27940 [Streptomyces sp. t39]